MGLTEAREPLLQLLERFQAEHLMEIPPEALVWDAYVDSQRRVYLVDLAPFHESTDPILFDWQQLRDADAETAAHKAELRLVESGAVHPSAQVYHGWPQELQQLDGGGLEALV